MSDPRTLHSGPPEGPAGRLRGIDFWRGVVLCTIFVNHVPGTVFERLTFKNFGFSDASESFVLIAGLSLALAYSRRIFAGDRAAVVAGLARRSVKLYGVHVGLSLAGVAIFAAAGAVTHNPDLMQQHGRDLVVDDPVAALVGLVSLGHQFGYFNILPMYIVLMGIASAMLLVAKSRPRLMLAASFGVYALSRLANLNVPTWPMSGVWFFDPFAWQALMAVGIAVGFRLRAGAFRIQRPILALTAAIVLSTAFCATDGLGLWPGLFDTVRPLADLDKTMLGLGRMVHSLSLAYCLWGLGIVKALQATWLYTTLSLVGEHGLVMFALTSILSAVGQALTQIFGHDLPLDAVIVGGGLAIMVSAAGLLSRRAGLALATVAR